MEMENHQTKTRAPAWRGRRTYDQVFEKVDPILRMYRDDLEKIDKELIEDNPGIPFLHFTGQTGTHIVFMPPADHECYPPIGEKILYLFDYADRQKILTDKQGTVNRMRGHHWKDLILFFNGKTVKETTLDRADSIIDEYVRSVRYAWGRVPQ